MNIFISYAKEDKEKVATLEEIVRHGGQRSWQFVYDLHGGRDWRGQIQFEIDRCEILLFVITEYSLQSEWCLKELQHAALSQKPILTVAFTPDIEIPYPINTIQYVLFDDTPVAGAKLTRALADPKPMSRDKIPSHWERLGGGPIGFPTSSQTQIPIPRIKREHTDMEKEDFLYEALRKIRDYFGRALSESESTDTRIQTRIRDESNTRFHCQLFLNGEIQQSCTIWISNNVGLHGIAYFEAHGRMHHFNMNSYNELAQVASLNGNLALEFTLGLRMFNQQDECRICTADKTAECLWRHFIRVFEDSPY
ncbi:MAG: toll/interleukin-1 receptor domain-containing protein [Chloroflexota bacterium]|nr:toll/interleukin-1 receptor domain-containing protein [Chloroflexota bacterium]MDE2947656.1 toll/interleukin-1 receptor domain-containing protein [Chloroflexota bacterium]